MIKLLSALVAIFAISTLASADTIKTDMKQIAESYSQLDKQLDDQTKNSSSIQILNQLITESKDAQNKVPPGLEKKSAAEKAKLTADYKTQMGMMVGKITETKTFLEKNDNKSARKTFDELKPWTQPDHAKKYQ